MNLKRTLKKYKLSIILPIAPIIFEIIVFTFLSSQLIWEDEDYNYDSPIIYTGPYYGITTLDLPESPTDKYLFIFELLYPYRPLDYYYLDLYVEDLVNSENFSYSLSVKGISNSLIMDISPGRYRFVWETNSPNSKFRLFTLGVLNPEGSPSFLEESGIKMLGGILIFTSFLGAIIVLFVKMNSK